MPRPDKSLISYSELAAECGVAVESVSYQVRTRGLTSHRLPYSAKGRALMPAEANVIRCYYAAKRQAVPA